MKNVNIVVATDINNGIAKNRKIPWNIPEDMAWFKKITTTTNNSDKMNAVVMGRKTWESLPPKFRPLPNRKNAILTKEYQYIQNRGIAQSNLCQYHDLTDAVRSLSRNSAVESIFIIGGSDVYNQTLNSKFPICEFIFLTKFHKDYECDTFINNIPDHFTLLSHTVNTAIDRNSNKELVMENCIYFNRRDSSLPIWAF
jgi:dihydrofolate reductase